MMLAIDVHYSDNNAYIAGVLFNDWADDKEVAVYKTHLGGIQDYQSGAFYKRELPCILKLLDEHNLSPDTIVIDGYVYLDGVKEPGLGKHLFDALNGEVNVIGVAKNPFRAITAKHEIVRGKSKKPLYITSIGMELDKAQFCILAMHGNFRIPKLIKKADTECRALAEMTNL